MIHNKRIPKDLVIAAENQALPTITKSGFIINARHTKAAFDAPITNAEALFWLRDVKNYNGLSKDKQLKMLWRCKLWIRYHRNQLRKCVKHGIIDGARYRDPTLIPLIMPRGTVCRWGHGSMLFRMPLIENGKRVNTGGLRLVQCGCSNKERGDKK